MTLIDVKDVVPELQTLLARVRAGEEVLIFDAGQPVARMLPATAPPPPLPPGELAAWEKRKLLLDTGDFIRSVTGDPRLPPSTVASLGASGNDLFLSPISVYEMAIKSAGKALTGPRAHGFCSRGHSTTRLTELPVRINRAAAPLRLPLHQKDPFDRLRVATAIEGAMGLVTADSEIQTYPVTIVW